MESELLINLGLQDFVAMRKPKVLLDEDGVRAKFECDKSSCESNTNREYMYLTL